VIFVALAAIDRLLGMPAADWRALGKRMLAVGFDDAQLARFDGIAPSLYGPPRDALLTWHLRQAGAAPWAHALRLFAAGDSIAVDEARALFGEAMQAKLEASGVLERRPADRIGATLYMLRIHGFFLAFDELSAGEDAAMGFGSTTIELWRAAHPDKRLGAILDLGCGAGACALAMSPQADRVVGTDINPRAVALGRVNAAVNGTTNVEFRAGDLFGPVAGETFDLVVSQPPFVARPDGAEERTYLFGGERGDELALRLLSELPAYLSAGGRAVVLIEFPEVAGDDIVGRVRGAIARGGGAATGDRPVRVLLLQNRQDVDDACVSYALAQHPSLGAGYANAVRAWRTHFERLGVRGQELTFTILEPADRGRAWIAKTRIRFREATIGLSKQLVDAAMAAHDLVAAGAPAWLSARLRVPDGSRFVEEKDEAGAVVLHLPAWRLADPTTLSADALSFVEKVHAADSVRAAIEGAAAEQEGATFEEACDVLLPAVEDLLRRGALEVA
jgi:SAM-dependent methyltransferase